MPLTAQGLEEVLTADGWPFQRLDETTWRSGFRAPGQRKIRFFLRLTENWLFLTIVPFALLPDDDEAAEHALLGKLLELNRRITLAKFALDGREIVLTVELPTQDITPSQVKDGLDALALYGSHYYAAITEFATPAP
jgi:Putative bacterial sensory transduction regulator